ncbi:1940_t:CDS:2 [Funneliformis geosporum]|nr:1940_t:CDS:2 [Funneliformis geosporum]
MSQIPPQVHETIEQFFMSSSTWSLFSFLQYREGVDDFTYDKVKEHMLYKSALNLLSKDHDQARKCLLNFETSLNRLRVIAITQLDGFVPTGCQTSCYVMADGVLRMLEGTTAGQQHVFNIQQQDLLGLYQSGDNDLTNTSMMSLSNILNHPGKRKSEGDHRPKTPPMRPRKVTVTTPEKPTLYKHTMQHLAKHFSVYVNNQCVIMKLDHVDLIPKEIRTWIVNLLSSEKDVFESNIMAPLNSTPAHPFQQICKTILYDFFSMTDKGPLNRFIGERKYTVDRIVPLFKAIQSVYREYLFDWIEVQASCIKDIKELFPEFDFTLNKVDGIGSKVSSNKEIIFIEVSGGPENAVLKHVKEDTEKLIKEAMFGLISLLRGYLGKGAEKARNICIKSAVLPFSFDEVEKFIEVFELLYALIDGLKKQTRELKKLMLADPISNVPTIRDWIWVPKNLSMWEATEVIYEDFDYEDLNYDYED